MAASNSPKAGAEVFEPEGTLSDSSEVPLPTTWGAALLLRCVRCGAIHYAARERKKAERMEDFHDQFCGNAVLSPENGQEMSSTNGFTDQV